MADEYTDILEAVLNVKPEVPATSSAQRSANLDTILSGELPSGVAIDQVVQAALKAGASSDADIAALQGQMQTLTGTQTGLREDTQAAMDKLLSTNSEFLATSQGLSEVSGDLNAKLLEQKLNVEQELIDTQNNQELFNAALLSEVNNVYGAAYSDFEKIQAGQKLGILDLIKNPVSYVKTSYEAKEARESLDINLTKAKVLDDQFRTNAAIYQATSGAQQLEATVYGNKYADKFQKQQVLQSSLNLLNTTRTVNRENIADLVSFYNLGEQAASSLEAQLRVAVTKKQLSAQDIATIAQGVQLKQADLLYKQTVAEIEANENFRVVMDPIIKTLFGPELLNNPAMDGWATYEKMLAAKMVPDDTHILVMNAASTGTLGTASIMNAADPYAAKNALSATAPSLLSEDMQKFFIEAEAEIRADPANQNMKEEEVPAAFKATLDTFKTSVQTDFDITVSKKLVTLHSPNYLDLTQIPGLQNPKVQTRLKSFRANTSNFNTYMQDIAMHFTSTDSDLSLEESARALASLSSFYANDLNQRTGLGIKHVRSPLLQNPRTMRKGDAQNPGDWVEYLKTLKARQRAISLAKGSAAGVVAMYPGVTK
jgi:hypothetical protein